jgi:hypothetical protein
MKIIKNIWSYLIDMAEILAESKRKINGHRGYY